MSVDYMGVYNHNLDSKNRLAVPAKFRDKLGSDFVVFKPLDEHFRCIFLYSSEGFDTFTERLTQDASGLVFNELQEAVFMNAYNVDMDGQGRFTLDSSFAEYAGLTKEVVVFGSGNKIELWSPEEFAKRKARPISAPGFDFTKIQY